MVSLRGSQIVSAWLAVALWMGVIFTFSSVPGLKSSLEPIYDFILRKMAHVAEYAVLTLLLYRAARNHGVQTKQALAIATLCALVFAGSDEWHQTFVTGRNGTLRDVAIDAVGIAGAFLWRKLKVGPAIN